VGLYVAVHDPGLVGGLQRFGDLKCHRRRSPWRQGTALEDAVF
jgi:hypothetical protein